MAAARPALEAIGVDPAHVSVITRDQVQHAKPDPDLFIAASSRLGVDSVHAVVVGDSVWAFWRRAAPAHSAWVSSRAVYGREELERAGAYRVYDDPADLLRHLDEVDVRARPHGVPKQNGARTATAEDYGSPHSLIPVIMPAKYSGGSSPGRRNSGFLKPPAAR